MGKAGRLLFCLIVGVIAVIIAVQWTTFNDQRKSDTTMKIHHAVITVSVETSSNELDITEEITGLNTDSIYQFQFPTNVSGFTCSNLDGKPCRKTDEQGASYSTKDKGFVLRYHVPINGDSRAFLLEDWIVKVGGVEKWRISINITDTNKQKGSWAAGIPFHGSESKDLIQYTVFKGKNTYPAIYWQREKLENVRITNGIDIYRKSQSSMGTPEFSDFAALAKKGHVSMVLTDSGIDASSSGLIVSREDKGLRYQLARELVSRRFAQLRSEEAWIIEAITSLFANDIATTGRAEKAITELKRNLSSEELYAFKELIAKEKNLLSFRRLDKLLGIAAGLETNYFSMNKDIRSPYTELAFHGKRSLFVNGRSKGYLTVMDLGESILLPARETIEALGYTYKVNKGFVYMEKGKESYRFQKDSALFEHNGEKFGLVERPFVEKEGVLFVKSETIQTLFNVFVAEEGRKIKLTSG
ncbi:stalk domain-containing protein [Bacillus massilinigeriensis]|uniref:stalk domain-containing protein n=1 Tax=Bacillus mediterraneensis TaxID=1805474 RepID=UPI0008F9683E|nr:stalk domain-containing protein [Bacillus mediterraneensis]